MKRFATLCAACAVLALSARVSAVAAPPAPGVAAPPVRTVVPAGPGCRVTWETAAAEARPAVGPAAIAPGMPDPNGPGVYRVQVGSFARAALAQRCFDRLRSANFDPRFEFFHSEEHGAVYRVVIPGVSAAEMPAVAARLGNAGFERALIRREN